MPCRRLAVAAVLAVLAIQAACEPDPPDPPASPAQPEPRGTTVEADDGFDLWFDAWGEGPAIIFLARHPDENRALADALSDGYRVVIHEPRVITLGQMGLLAEAADEAERGSGKRTWVIGRSTGMLRSTRITLSNW